MHKMSLRAGVLVLVLAASAARASAQADAGVVAAVVGTLQIQRAAGAWENVSIGFPVVVGDRFRTGASDLGAILLGDSSVVNLAPDTELLLDTLAFGEAARRPQATLRLAKGGVRAWVGDAYRQGRARFEVETPTAIADVRGTEFVVVYNAKTQTTDVVGIADEVEVVGRLGVMGAAVQVGPQISTRVQKGRFPTPAQPVDEARFRQYLAATEIVGTGRRDGLNVLHPAIAGRLLAAADVPSGATAPAAPSTAKPGMGPPPEPLAYRLSPDVYTNTQPLRDFELTPPGRVPSGGVHVGF